MKEPFISGFLKTLRILKDYLSVIVTGGGWAPVIYYRYVLGDKAHALIFTRDIDFMVQHQVPVIGSKTVDQSLVEAGFEAVFRSLSQKYPAWYQTFLKNLRSYFVTSSSEGVLRVVQQRPPATFPKLNEDQFKNFIFAAFRDLIQNLSKKS